jgi:hypothetical protein
VSADLMRRTADEVRRGVGQLQPRRQHAKRVVTQVEALQRRQVGKPNRVLGEPLEGEVERAKVDQAVRQLREIVGGELEFGEPVRSPTQAGISVMALPDRSSSSRSTRPRSSSGTRSRPARDRNMKRRPLHPCDSRARPDHSRLPRAHHQRVHRHGPRPQRERVACYNGRHANQHTGETPAGVARYDRATGHRMFRPSQADSGTGSYADERNAIAHPQPVAVPEPVNPMHRHDRMDTGTDRAMVQERSGERGTTP